MPQQNQAAGKLKHSEKVFSATPTARFDFFSLN
jgi:hypothetical protein